jgi:hypothetical protein
MLRTDLVLDEFGDAAGYCKHIVDCAGGCGRERSEEGEEASLLGSDGEPGAEVVAESVRIAEREVFKAGIEEEIEWIDGFEVGDEVNFYSQLRREIGEEDVGLLILMGIEPPL